MKLKLANGEVKHLLNSIQLGAYRRAVYYAGQPKGFRRCGSLEHLAATSHTQLFEDCPRAYSNRLKGQATPAHPYPEFIDWSDEQQEDTQNPVTDPVEIPDPENKGKEPKTDTPAPTTTPPEVRLLQQKTLGAEKILNEILAQLPAQPPAGVPDDEAPGVEETGDQGGQHISSSDQDLTLSLDHQRIPEASSPERRGGGACEGPTHTTGGGAGACTERLVEEPRSEALPTNTMVQREQEAPPAQKEVEEQRPVAPPTHTMVEGDQEAPPPLEKNQQKAVGEGDPLDPLNKCLSLLLKEPHNPKRPLSESSSGNEEFPEKRGRAGSPSDSDSVEEPRVFPSDSPNEVSFLSGARHSTPKLPLVEGHRRDQATSPPSPIDEESELDPQRINMTWF
uniref:Uncharacterized protein n=1 Tax=Knipowitschia caucasica TaxID=637954 RepID=A0AAV2MG26_KNICA